MPGWPRSRPRSSVSRSSSTSIPDHLPLIDQLREEYDHEAEPCLPSPAKGPDEAEQELLDHRAIRKAVLVAEREAVIGLRDDGVINDETLRAHRARPGPGGAAGGRLSGRDAVRVGGGPG